MVFGGFVGFGGGKMGDEGWGEEKGACTEANLVVKFLVYWDDG